MNEPTQIIQKLPIVVLISGNGSNLQAIIDAIHNGLPIKICAVISNKADAFGLARALKANLPTHIIEHKNFTTREAFDAALQRQIDCYKPKLVVLAGFMRRLTNAFVQHYHHRLINIHPSLLPKYPGLNTHQRAIAAGEAEHGATIHFVTEDLDSGPIIHQTHLTIKSDDTPHSLQMRVLQLEHQMYPEVLGWFAEGKIDLPSS